MIILARPDIRKPPDPSSGEDPVGRVAATPTYPVQRLVLDTNVVLDWLHFGDPSCGALGRAIESGRVHWIATEPMRQELESVLTRGIPGRWPVDLAGVLRTWDRWVIGADRLEASTGSRTLACRPVPSLRCRDADDQKFIDLALAAGAAALLSRDRAVLRLARPAAARGLRILTLAEWRPAAPA